ncbi:MAG TPA: carbon-nitrogen hydrolase family protein [Candidatus Nanopelagicaceae bacterium]|nr:carbon-nitrogen hydrolase family protein [Candidatus Nanopelagicaceae bacterium]
MRAFTAAAIQISPVPGPLSAESIEANIAKALEYVQRCAVATGAELVVLPETVTTGFTPGVSPEKLWDLIDVIPGSITQPFCDLAKKLEIHLVHATYERGETRGEVFNSSILIGPSGNVLGRYRKTHPFCTENISSGGWVTPGDEVAVIETDLGKIGMIICFDGDFPELSRIQALLGAEILIRPSALLRSADIWELTNRARAYDNHVYVIGANAVGIDPAGVLYFGNSMIVTPTAEVIARAATHEGWISARLDPETAMSSLTPGSNIAQSFDHLADRNLALLKNYSDVLQSKGATSFKYSRP